MKKLIIMLIIPLIAIIWTGSSSDNNVSISIPKPTEAQYTDKNGVGYNDSGSGSLSTAAFKNKKKDVVIPEKIQGKKVKAIGKSSFKMSKAETVIIPDTVDAIEDYAFAFSRTLKKVIIPDSVKYIGINAFAGCTSLTEIKLPKKLETIGMYSFDASGLKKVTIPKSVKTVGEYAFAECKNLKDVTFKGKNTELADTVFNHSISVAITAPKKSKAISFAQENGIEYKVK